MRVKKGDFALKGCDNVGEHVQAEGGPAHSRGINHGDDKHGDDKHNDDEQDGDEHDDDQHDDGNYDDEDEDDDC